MVTSESEINTAFVAWHETSRKVAISDFLPIKREDSIEERSISEESDEEEDGFHATVPSGTLQKLDDLLLFSHNQKDNDLSKLLVDAISKVENIGLKQTKANRCCEVFK